MLPRTEQLPDDPALLKSLLLKQMTRVEELEELVRFYKSREFSRSKESYMHPGQGTLFNEAEDIESSSAPDEESKQTITYTRGMPTLHVFRV